MSNAKDTSGGAGAVLGCETRSATKQTSNQGGGGAKGNPSVPPHQRAFPEVRLF